MTVYLRLLSKKLSERFAPRTLLDIGCGSGGLVEAFQEHGINAYGIDMSKNSLSFSIEGIRGSLIIGSADSNFIPFTNNSFDMVTAHHAIEHLYTPDQFIPDMARILRRGGILVIVVPISPFGWTKLWKILRLQTQPDHVSLHSKRFWINIFGRHGFTLIGDLREIVMTAPTSFWVGRLLLRLGRPGRWLWWVAGSHLRQSFIFQLSEDD